VRGVVVKGLDSERENRAGTGSNPTSAANKKYISDVTDHHKLLYFTLTVIESTELPVSLRGLWGWCLLNNNGVNMIAPDFSGSWG
jgi:hypothetical protein